jgi:hypothetical protein
VHHIDPSFSARSRSISVLGLPRSAIALTLPVLILAPVRVVLADKLRPGRHCYAFHPLASNVRLAGVAASVFVFL